jgi:hypothetical protein
MSEETVSASRSFEPARRIEELENQVRMLAAAVRALADGLAPNPVADQPRVDAAEDGARLAHDLLVSAGL